MSEWIDFDRWPECPQMEKPGYVFEVTNEEQQTLLTPCVVPLEVPFDWRSPPLKFRLVAEPEPRHSDPIPAPSAP